MSTAERLFTIRDFEQLGEPDEGGKLELDEGRLIRHVPVNAHHGMIQVAIGSALRTFVRTHRIGAVMVENAYQLAFASGSQDVVRAPDVSYVARSLTDEERAAPTLPFAPDLAVEVTSPSDRDLDVQRKVRQYLAAGVHRVWVVRPGEQSLTVHRSGGDAHTYSDDDVLTGEDAGFDSEEFRLPLEEIFGR